MASFKEGSQIFSDPSLLPKTWTLANYRKGWEGIGIVPFGRFFANSFTICILCVVANTIFCSLTAYAFARLQFRGRRSWFAVTLLTMMLPGHVTTIPRNVIFRSFGWINTILSFTVPKLFATDSVKR